MAWFMEGSFEQCRLPAQKGGVLYGGAYRTTTTPTFLYKNIVRNVLERSSRARVTIGVHGYGVFLL